MSRSINLMHRLREVESSLTPAEARVARSVLDDPEAILHITLADLAGRANVSEPTVVRFTRSVGCDGFQEFKVRLAQSTAHHFPYADLSVHPGDSVEDYGTKVFDATLTTLFSLRERIDRAAVASAVEHLQRAKTIEFYGLGASGIVALDAHHKFFRLPIPCAAYSDNHMQIMAASRLTKGDVVVAISHTGRTKELIDSVQVARRAGAFTIAITRSDTPLAEVCELLLAVEAPEDTDIYTPMTSRIAHLAVVDVLALGVALGGGEDTTDRFRRIKAELRRKRLKPRGKGPAA